MEKSNVVVPSQWLAVRCRRSFLTWSLYPRLCLTWMGEKSLHNKEKTGLRTGQSAKQITVCEVTGSYARRPCTFWPLSRIRPGALCLGQR